MDPSVKRNLRFAYLLNAIVLLPVSVPALLRLYAVDNAAFQESAGWPWRVLLSREQQKVAVETIVF